jgi:hypothetical protein
VLADFDVSTPLIDHHRVANCRSIEVLAVVLKTSIFVFFICTGGLAVWRSVMRWLF